MIKKIFEKLFEKRKSSNSKNAAEKLWGKIQDDYYGYVGEKYKLIPNNRGFLNTNITINRKEYCIQTDFDYLSNGSFKLFVLYNGIEVFGLICRYGVRGTDKLTEIVLQEFYRCSDQRLGIGGKMMDFLVDIARDYNFDYFGINPVATYEQGKEYMTQEQLEKFYKSKLPDGEKPILEFRICNDVLGVDPGV